VDKIEEDREGRRLREKAGDDLETDRPLPLFVLLWRAGKQSGRRRRRRGRWMERKRWKAMAAKVSEARRRVSAIDAKRHLTVDQVRQGAPNETIGLKDNLKVDGRNVCVCVSVSVRPRRRLFGDSARKKRKVEPKNSSKVSKDDKIEKSRTRPEMSVRKAVYWKLNRKTKQLFAFK
jgi:hypothetical protein